MRIEPATSAHAQAIAAIYDEAARTTPATFDLEGHTPDWWAGVIAAGDYPFVVAVDGDVIGFARATQHKVKPAYATTCETSVYVAGSARGHGAGRALIAAVTDWARERGCARLYWSTQESNATARRLYDQVAQNRGFIRYDITL